MPADPLTIALATTMRINALALRQLLRAEAGLAGLALASLSPRHLSTLTARIYAARKRYWATEIFDWERDWLEAELPPPPARVLVGGAGAGREVAWLLDRGYEVVAFDPASSFVRAANQSIRTPRLLAFVEGSYESLLEPNHALAQAVETHGPHDAVLLGWGSFTHVPDPEDRVAVLRRLAALCPSGPVLLSFWLRLEQEVKPRTRAFRLGWRVGSALTGRAGQAEPQPGDTVKAHCGFAHWFSPREIEDLAAAAGLTVTRTPGRDQVYAHATMRPGS